MLEVLRSPNLAMGPRGAAFERAMAEFAGVRHAISANSGTSALHLVVRALGIGDRDEVITTPFSFVASSNCLLFERATPVFVDIDPKTLCIDPARVERAITSRTKAILAVDVFGHPADWPALEAIAKRHRLLLVEDSAESLGSALGRQRCGSFGRAAVFAFYPNKQITTGEGGMVVTDDPALADTMRSLRNQGRDTDGTWLRHVRLGYNYRLDELSAAVGVAQLERLAELRAGRARVAAAYQRALGGADWVRLPRAGAGEAVDWFVYVVRLHEEIDRDDLIGRLAKVGVPARPYFSPLHLQPFYRSTFGYQPGDFPVTERVAASTLALPFSSRLTDEEVQYAADALIGAVG